MPRRLLSRERARLPGLLDAVKTLHHPRADSDETALVGETGTQLAALSYPGLGQTEILGSVDAFYKRFYFRAGKIAEMSAEMVRSPEMAARRLREGREFVQFLGRRDREA